LLPTLSIPQHSAARRGQEEPTILAADAVNSAAPACMCLTYLGAGAGVGAGAGAGEGAGDGAAAGAAVGAGADPEKDRQ